MVTVHRPQKLAMAAKYHRAHGRPDLAADLEAQLTQASRWRLTDSASVAAGIGPDCATRATHGHVCPGWPKGSHAAACNPRDLVTDHDVGVLSRQCNSRKAATYDKQRARGEGGSKR